MAAVDQETLHTELKKKRICRFCLCQDPSKMTNIYMRDTRIKSSAPLPIQIMAIASIEVFSNDGMPAFVCCDCISMFEFSYQFKQMCKKADNILRQFPLTGKLPSSLVKPILHTNTVTYGTVVTPSSIKSETTQLRKVQSTKPPVQQESVLLAKKILNSSVSAKATAAANVSVSHSASESKVFAKITSSEGNCSVTLFDKIENNEELSMDDIHQLVAEEDVNESKFDKMENLPLVVIDTGNKHSKPKLLNKSSIRILNKDADQVNEPRLSLPKIKKAEDGKMEIVAEILNADDKHEEEADPKNAIPIETNVFSCDCCERTFPLLQLRDIHMKKHTRDRKFHCTVCDKSFFSKYDLNRHLLIHSVDKPFKCSVCNKGFARSTLLTRHERSHIDVPKFICIHCERSFLSKDEMEKHAERHYINRPFVCKICNKSFAFKQGLERHEVVHSRQQPYSCEYCDRSFSTTTKLARHLTAHAGVRPYPCKYCKKSYLLSHHLTRHLRSHKNVEDPVNAISFSCAICNTRFESRADLVRHSSSHANENMACPLCKEVFANMQELTSHIQEHSEGDAYACEFCDLIFMSAEKLQLHTDLEHSKEMEAYHADDRAQADKQRKDDKRNQTKDDSACGEKFQRAVDEFLDDEYSTDEGESENSLKSNIKIEEVCFEPPKVTDQIIIKKGNQKEDNNLTIPFKQRKIDVASGDVVSEIKLPEQAKQSHQLKRTNPIAAGSSAKRDARQPTIQSMLSPSIIGSIKPQNTLVSKPRTPQASLSKTPPSKEVPVTNSKLTAKIKVENEPSKPAEVIDNDAAEKDEVVTKKHKLQKITLTKTQAAAMAREGRIKIKDGKIILHKRINE